MPFDFPPVAEVALANPPLREVICQVRFPVIFRIASELPTCVQDRLRQEFPEGHDELETLFELREPTEGAPQVKQTRIYRFRTSDQCTTVGLTSTFYSLSTTRYAGWDAFRGQLGRVTAAVSECYELENAARVGLRFINALELSTEERGIGALAEMIRPEASAFLLQGRVQDPVVAHSELRARQEDGTMLTIRLSLEDEDSGGRSLLLDLDCYTTERTAIASVATMVDRFHELEYRAFRWLTTDKLLERYGGQRG